MPAALPAHVDVAIVGAGPAGLATAHAVAQVLPGRSIALFDKVPPVTVPRGAGLGLDVNGLKALQACAPPAVFDAIQQHASVAASMETRDPNGNVVRTFDIRAQQQAAKAKFGIHSIQLGWHELVSSLGEHLPEQAKVYNSTRFVRYEEVEAGVKLHMEHSPDGKNWQPAVVNAGLVVAADGFFSKVRQQCLQDGPPEFGGAMVWRARIQAEEAERFGYPEGKTVMYFGKNSVVLVYTAGQGHIVWTASCQESALEEAGVDWKAVAQARRESSAQSDDYLQRTDANGREAKGRLLCLFKDWEAPLLELFESTKPSAIVEHALYVRAADELRPECFGKGRVVIVGDAAHPMRPTGQGTNQAFEDALLLGRYIQRDGGGFGLLEEFRRYRAARLQPIMKHVEVQGKASYNADGKKAAKVATETHVKDPKHTSEAGAAGSGSDAAGSANKHGVTGGEASTDSNPAVTNSASGAAGSAVSGTAGDKATADTAGGDRGDAAVRPQAAQAPDSRPDLLADWEGYVYCGEDFAPLNASQVREAVPV